MVKNRSKTHFSKSDHGSFGMLKQVVVAHFEPVRRFFGHGKSQNALKVGRLGTKNGSKMVKNVFFQKSSQTFWDAQTSVLSPF